MDRSVMEGDPHRMIEGMMIAAYAVQHMRIHLCKGRIPAGSQKTEDCD